MPTHTDLLDEILASYEQRAITRTPEDIEHQRTDIALGQNLGRIQGAQPSTVRSSLVELVILGKATPSEVMSLGAEIARRGLFTASDMERHDSR
jgi:hypothetical protein